MLSMRITGGKFCGRKVFIPEGELEIRPAMDRMRESLFSILGPLTNLSFLDLFSGSGCVAIEALSRGANPVHLVELDISKKDVINKNISFAKSFNLKIDTFFSDALSYIENCKYIYSIIYADPPFPMPNKEDILLKISENNILEEKGLFIIHIPSTELNLWSEKYTSKSTFTLMDQRKYGRNALLFYKKEDQV